MKKNILLIILLGLSSLISYNAMAQDSDGLTCFTANPFCSDSAYYFPNNSTADGVSSPPGPDYGCLFSQPNPIWYYMKIDEAGTILLSIAQTTAGGVGIDIDFAMWGPFTELEVGCTEIMTGTLSPLQCSYSASATETVGIGLPGGFGGGASTPPAAESGDIYIIILTNYSGQPGNISFSQTGGTGSTDCSIINCGLEVSNSGPICPGGTVQLFGNEESDEGTVSISWVGPGGFTSTLANPTLTIATAGSHDFTCTSVVTVGEDSDTCIEVTTVIVNPDYKINESGNICAGSVYEWRGEIYFTSGTYEHVYKTIEGCDSTYKLNLIVNPMPNVEITASNQFICEGQEAVLTNLYPAASSIYQWIKDDVAIPGATQSSYTATVGGEYRLHVITDKGCADTSRRITITVHPAASVSLNPVNVEKLCIGDTIKMSVDGKPGYEYRWFPQKFFIYSSDRGYSEANAILFQPSYITVEAFNEFGCMASDSVWVNPIPCCDVYIPTGFTPNGDGYNDFFNILLRDGQKVVSFQIFDRYGKMVYDNGSRSGWSGRDLDGNEATQAVYFYRLVYTCADKQNYELKGDVTLVR